MLSVHPELVEGLVASHQGFDELSPNGDENERAKRTEFVGHAESDAGVLQIRLKTSVELVPPKPKLFDITTSTLT
jgi:hypothetical protein